jgi:hypothetical protein
MIYQMNNVKEYELNEGALVIYHTLDSLYQHFYSCIPKEFEKRIVDLIVDLRDYLEPPDDEFKDNDMNDFTFIRKVFYKISNEQCDLDQNKKNNLVKQ